jgi:hypothetical protein
VLTFSEYSSNKALWGKLVCSSRESPIGCPGHGLLRFRALQELASLRRVHDEIKELTELSNALPVPTTK